MRSKITQNLTKNGYIIFKDCIGLELLSIVNNSLATTLKEKKVSISNKLSDNSYLNQFRINKLVDN